MGLLIAVGNTKPTFPYDYFYGVKINLNVADPQLERVGRPELHVSLPIQSAMRRCLLRDDGTVATYLHPTDSTKTDTGAAADLTGTTGQVMVEIPAHYRKFEFDGVSNWFVLLSQYPLPGFHRVPTIYRSAYQATVDRTDTAHPKLASVVNTTANFRGCGNNAANDGTYKSGLGMPATSITLTNFRNYARNRGEAGLNGCGWNCDTYDAQKAVYWLYVVEYANLNSQAEFNAQPDANGYRQGGLGAGVTTLANAKWNTFNGYYPFIPCGHTNSLGNATGVVPFQMPTEYDPEAAKVLTVQVPSYRGIENPFGHIWHWTDGCKCAIQSEADGGKSLFYSTHDPANFQDTSIEGYTLRGELPRKDGYVKRMMLGDEGDNMPTGSENGNAATYYCDYFYQNVPATGTALRGVLFGGGADSGAAAGLVSASTNSAATTTRARIGSRLCFIPD